MKNRDLILHYIRLSEVKAIHIHDPTKLPDSVSCEAADVEAADQGGLALLPAGTIMALQPQLWVCSGRRSRLGCAPARLPLLAVFSVCDRGSAAVCVPRMLTVLRALTVPQALASWWCFNKLFVSCVQVSYELPIVTLPPEQKAWE